MRLATLLTPSGPRAVAFHNGRIVSLDALEHLQPKIALRDFLQYGPQTPNERQTFLDTATPLALDEPLCFLPPIPNPPKIVCLGLNYRDHAAESGAPIPKEPVLFSKYPTALVGHEANIVLPPVSTEVDFEAELVLVVGKRGRPTTSEDAATYLAGYTIGHDVSARDWQLKKDGKQWMAGKTFDTFAPTGPYFVTADEIANPHDLAIELRLNGQVMQDSNTSQMVFPVGEVLVYLAKIFTLEPGDLIFTGTPPGVGFARKPPVYLQPGDVVEVEIEHLGVLRNRVVQG
jgi:2-keto-4-pentenoate hydratase/2-oxohepta-3-ene-1,7-dioic acid hydratase in catechol pathway